ncbi:MAG TPA: hypothetical protein VK167_00540 [Flavipsychrobacter sp.]|nr:hypothetical protein [Flavipsychrobacter sp.]
MKLSETWFMEGYIDFELQKYRLLAYLQEVNQYFTEHKLYPQLGDIVFHYNNLVAFKEHKKLMQDSFPKQLSNVNLQKLELVYEEMLQDNAIMQELENIIQYALAQMKPTLNNGAELYEQIEKQLRIEPVGIMPLYKNEGYILVRYGNYSEVKAYNYTITLFENQNDKYRGIRLSYIDTWQNSIANTYESIKRDIIKAIRTLPNPAVFSVEYPLHVPLDETLLPVAKRALVRQIGIA